VFAFLILLAPTSSVVPIKDPLAERRVYVAFIGLLFLAIGLLRLWRTSRTTLAAVLSVVLLAESALTYQRNQLWSNTIALWQDSVANSPNKVRPHFQLAFAHYLAGHCNDAVDEFGKTAQLGQPDYGMLVDWALAYDCAGDPNMAIAKLNGAAALERTAHVYSQIGMEYAKQAKYPEALEALNTAVSIDPNFDPTYVYRGNIYNVRGDLQKAAEEYRRALAINPDNQSASQALQRIAR
jgi:protein O-mannosyl-transferase